MGEFPERDNKRLNIEINPLKHLLNGFLKHETAIAAMRWPCHRTVHLASRG